MRDRPEDKPEGKLDTESKQTKTETKTDPEAEFRQKEAELEARYEKVIAASQKKMQKIEAKLAEDNAYYKTFYARMETINSDLSKQIDERLKENDKRMAELHKSLIDQIDSRLEEINNRLLELGSAAPESKQTKATPKQEEKTLEVTSEQPLPLSQTVTQESLEQKTEEALNAIPSRRAWTAKKGKPEVPDIVFCGAVLPDAPLWLAGHGGSVTADITDNLNIIDGTWGGGYHTADDIKEQDPKDQDAGPPH